MTIAFSNLPNIRSRSGQKKFESDTNLRTFKKATPASAHFKKLLRLRLRPKNILLRLPSLTPQLQLKLKQLM